jgi:hypothetical protein
MDMWTIGFADRLRFPRFPSKLGRRGNACLRPHLPGAENVDVGFGLVAQPNLRALARSDDTRGEVNRRAKDIALSNLISRCAYCPRMSGSRSVSDRYAYAPRQHGL